MKIHFIGIGGIGMSALARYFKFKKWTVSGSDLVASPLTRSLQHEGMNIKTGRHTTSVLKRDIDLVVYNRAIGNNNPELVGARKLKLSILPYAEVLGALTKTHKTVAITGSHGKTTTTALTGLTLVKGGLNPTIFIGTNLKELGGKNVRIGKGPHLVLEADDFGGAFLHYSPTIAVITNIDKEHLDFYKNFINLQEAFLKFLARTAVGGVLILNRDDARLFSLKPRIALIAKEKRLRTIWYSLRDPAAKKIKKVLQLPGEHNLSDAIAAYQIGKMLKISEKKILQTLGAYQGAWRRMEYRGMFDKAMVYDDYAHHPTEIKATLKGFHEKFSHSPIVCVFQPHQAQRLAALFEEFQSAFDSADSIILLPFYKVAGRDEKIIKNKDSAALASAMEKRFPSKPIFYANNPKRLKSLLVKTASRPSVIVMMGAGDIVNYTDSLIQ